MAINYTGTRPAPWLGRAVYQFNPDNNAYVADQIAPPISSPEQTGTLPVIPRESMTNDDTSGTSTRRPPGGTYKRDDLALEGVAFAAEGYGFEVPVPKEHVEIYGGVMPAMIAGTQKARGRLYQDKEFRMKNLLFNTTTWTGTSLYKDYSAAPWGTAGSDIITQINFAIDKVETNSGVKPNALILPTSLWRNMIYTNTAIKGMLTGFERATPGALMEFIKQLFELEKVIVAGGVYNSANSAQAATMAKVWGTDYAMVARVATTSDPSESCVARQVSWQAMGAGTDMSVSTYMEPQTKSTVIQGDLYSDEIVVDPYFGFLLKAIV